MEYDEVKSRLAPCGLHCGKCYAFVDGDIKKLSNQLKDSLGDFDVYASRFTEELLFYFASVDCKGCRNEKCKIYKDCKVRDCFEKKEIDYCFQCSDFPCNNTGFDQHLQKRSVDINNRMRVIGVENYYNEIKDKPRY
jgi:hypothetical protein